MALTKFKSLCLLQLVSIAFIPITSLDPWIKVKPWVFSFFLACSFGAQRRCPCVPGTQAQLQMFLIKVMVGRGLSWTNEEASRRPTYEQAHQTVEKSRFSCGNRRIQSNYWSGVGSWWTKKKKNKYESSQLVTFICGLFHSFPGFPQQLSMTREHKSNETCSSLSWFWSVFYHSNKNQTKTRMFPWDPIKARENKTYLAFYSSV